MGTTRRNKQAVRDIAALMPPEYQPDLVLMVGVGHAHEVPVMREFWPDARYLGFEAHPKLAAQSEHLETVHAAVVMPDNIDEVVFYGRRGNPQASSLWKREEGRNDTLTVPATSLDRILHDYGLEEKQHILLWQDAEGAELSAMKGGPEFMGRVDFLNIEMTPKGSGRPGWPPAGRVHRWLWDNGFERIHIHHGKTETEPHDAVYVRKGTLHRIVPGVANA